MKQAHSSGHGWDIDITALCLALITGVNLKEVTVKRYRERSKTLASTSNLKIYEFYTIHSLVRNVYRHYTPQALFNSNDENSVLNKKKNIPLSDFFPFFLFPHRLST